MITNKYLILFILLIFVISCSKPPITIIPPPPSQGLPTLTLNGNDSLKVGDSTYLKFTMTGTTPYSITYTDGSSNFTINNIDSNRLSVLVKPLKTTIFEPVSIKDKNSTGTTSGQHKVWVQPIFSSKSPNYSQINRTVGNIQNSIFFQGKYYHIDEITQLFTFSISNIIYQMGDHSYTIIDFNQDGYLDLFGFCFSTMPVFGRNPGKYILVDNVISNKRKVSFFDSDISAASGMEANDFNSDGINDVVFYSYNTHTDMEGLSLNPPKPVKIFMFKKDGSFKEVDATEPIVVHDMATGDLNNDGAIDMLVWQYGEVGGIYKPRIYLNNGNANFSESPTNDIVGLDEILNSRSSGIGALATELIDLNNDGNLDIIFSFSIGGVEWDYTFHNEKVLFKLPNQRILWGSGNGKFDIKSNFTDLPNNTIPQWSRTQPSANDSVNTFNKNNKLALGFNFVDYNNDGRLDVLTTITPHYSGYFLQLHQNMGDNSFKDVTSEIIDSYNGLINGPNSLINGNFPNFYEIRPFDIDNDGDFDLIPQGVACWEGFAYSKNLYWENVGSKFILKK